MLTGWLDGPSTLALICPIQCRSPPVPLVPHHQTKSTTNHSSTVINSWRLISRKTSISIIFPKNSGVISPKSTQLAKSRYSLILKVHALADMYIWIILSANINTNGNVFEKMQIRVWIVQNFWTIHTHFWTFELFTHFWTIHFWTIHTNTFFWIKRMYLKILKK